MRISTRGHFPPAFPEFYAPHPCRLPRWKKPIKIKLFGHVCLLKKLLKGTVQNKNREGIYIFVQKPLFKIFEAKWNVVLKILDGMKYQRDSFHQLVVHVSCARGRTRRKSAFHVTLCLAYDEI